MLVKIPSSAAITNNSITDHEEVLSLSHLKSLTIENSRYIGNIKDPIFVGPNTAILVAIATLVTYCQLSKLRRKRKETQHNHVIQDTIDRFRRCEDGSHLSGGAVNTLHLTLKISPISLRGSH